MRITIISTATAATLWLKSKRSDREGLDGKSLFVNNFVAVFQDGSTNSRVNICRNGAHCCFFLLPAGAGRHKNNLALLLDIGAGCCWWCLYGEVSVLVCGWFFLCAVAVAVAFQPYNSSWQLLLSDCIIVIKIYFKVFF